MNEALFLEFQLPNIYSDLLVKIEGAQPFYIEGTGIIIYKKSELLERNSTYQIQDYEPNYLLIAQDGDLAFFIKKDEGDNIYKNDLGALGALDMEYISSNVYEFLEYAKEHYDEF